MASMPRLLSTLSLPPYMLEKLRTKGFITQRDVLELQPVTLAQELGVNCDEAVNIQRAVKSVHENDRNGTNGGRSAIEMLQYKRSRRPIFTLNRQLDDMLGGGVARGEVTEFCGVPGMGKTQIAMQLACDVQIPRLFGGPEGKAVYIDTEGSFMAERAHEIAQGLINHMRAMTQSQPDGEYYRVAHSLTAEQILSNIFYFRVYDYVEQMATVQSLTTFLESQPNVRLVVLDSVAFHFRRDFDDMALRARLLTSMAQCLQELASRFDLAVVLTNQVTTKIRSNASHLVPALGESWAHACTNRCMFMWKDNQRCAELIKSPTMRPNQCYFAITADGLRGVDASRKRKHKDMNAETSANSTTTSA